MSYWKGKISPGQSDALICQMDLLASIGRLVGEKVGESDSEDMLDLLLGNSDQGRESLVIEATTRTAFKKGDWVMIPPYDGEAIAKDVNIELGNSESFMLFNLKDDPGQLNNLATSNPGKLEELKKEFLEIRGDYTGFEKLELK